MQNRIHLVGANTKNCFGMEYFVSKAFKDLGYEVIETDYRIMNKYEVNTRIKYITDIDFLLAIKAERVEPESIFSCRVPTVLWCQDSIQANQEMNFTVQTKSPLFDLVYSFNDAELPFYRQFNKNSYFLPLGADQLVHRQIENTDKTIDVGFVGNLNNNRINMINFLLDKGIPIQYSYSTEKYVEIVGNTKINLNIGITPTGIQQRIFEILCMGGFLITNKLQGGIEIFKDKEHLIYYNNFNHLYDLICYYIDKIDEREKIAQAGQKEVLGKHLYIHRVKTIVDKINSL